MVGSLVSEVVYESPEVTRRYIGSVRKLDANDEPYSEYQFDIPIDKSIDAWLQENSLFWNLVEPRPPYFFACKDGTSVAIASEIVEVRNPNKLGPVDHVYKWQLRCRVQPVRSELPEELQEALTGKGFSRI